MAKGLMERDSMDDDHGMIFIYSKPQIIKIWMLNTLMDLSVAFLDENKVVREIHHLKAYPKVRDPAFFRSRQAISSEPLNYALEMKAGWFEDHGVKPGDKVDWDGSSSRGFVYTQCVR